MNYTKTTGSTARCSKQRPQMVFKDIPHTSKVECLQMSTFFELEPTSEAGDLWTPDLGPLSRHSVFFWKELF